MTKDVTLDIEHRELSGDRLCLRLPRISDAGPLALYAGDERVAAMTTSIPHPYPPGAAEGFIDVVLNGRSPEVVWAIDATPDGGEELIGLISVKRAAVELGYWVGPPFWGTGYASEAAAMVCRYLLEECGTGRISATVFFDNPASQRVLTRAGFRHSGETWVYSIARQMEVPARTFELTAESMAAA